MDKIQPEMCEKAKQLTKLYLENEKKKANQLTQLYPENENKIKLGKDELDLMEKQIDMAIINMEKDLKIGILSKTSLICKSDFRAFDYINIKGLIDKYNEEYKKIIYSKYGYGFNLLTTEWPFAENDYSKDPRGLLYLYVTVCFNIVLI